MFHKTVIALLLIAVTTTSSAHADLNAKFIAASKLPLKNPHDLKLSPDRKHLYVSDVGNNRVAILNPETLALVAEFGADHQSGTHDVDFDPNQTPPHAYVADTHNNRVTIYNLGNKLGAPKLIGELKERIRGPEGVLYHPNDRIYVAGAWSGNVVAYEKDTKSGTWKVAAERTGLSSPHDVEMDQHGDIWLAEAGRDRLHLMAPDLSILKTWKGAPFNFKGVRYLDIMRDGTIIAADKNNHQVKFISKDGKLLLTLGDGKPGKGPNKFRTPEGVEHSGTTLYLSDSGNNRIVKYEIVR